MLLLERQQSSLLQTEHPGCCGMYSVDRQQQRYAQDSQEMTDATQLCRAGCSSPPGCRKVCSGARNSLDLRKLLGLGAPAVQKLILVGGATTEGLASSSRLCR